MRPQPLCAESKEQFNVDDNQSQANRERRSRLAQYRWQINSTREFSPR